MTRKVSCEFGDTWRLILMNCTLMMAASSFKTYVTNFHLKWHHIPEYFNLLEQCCETRKSCICYTHFSRTFFLLLHALLFKCLFIAGALNFFWPVPVSLLVTLLGVFFFFFCSLT
jgi:hypothetical protein